MSISGLYFETQQKNNNKNNNCYQALTKNEEDSVKFHAWVYVEIGETAFFIESTSGERIGLTDENYRSINAVWNHENYWLCLGFDDWKSRGSLKLNDEGKWAKFVGDSLAERKRLLSPVTGWMQDLNVPADSYELLYRLGQKCDHFKRVKVEHFAAYLLKEGIVQKVRV